MANRKRVRVAPVVGEPVPVTTGPAAPPPAASWVDWYNTKASRADQGWFDQAASVIDNGGDPYKKGGSQETWIEQYRGRGPDFYDALVNYRDTGGRRALFAVPGKEYSTHPISEPRKGGPIERVNPTMLVLHPGRYSYSDVTADGPAFRAWLVIVKEAVTVGQKQVSAAVLGGDPYYVDYELMVIHDTAWPTMVGSDKLQGQPTWIPKGINIIDYWGQVTTSHPDWDAPGRALSHAAEMARGIATLAGVLAVAYVVYSLKPASPPPPEPRRLT